MPHDPGITASVLGAGSALLALLAMSRVACIDIRCFEIDPDWLSLAAWASLAAIMAIEGPDAWLAAVAAAVVAGSGTWLAARLRRGRIGQGDVGLFAVLGLVAGPELLPPVLGLSAVFCLAACIAYGLARGKRPAFRSAIPAALPCMAALAPVFAWRVVSGIGPEAVPPNVGSAAAAALSGLAFLSAGLLAGALPMAVRRRDTARVAQLRARDGRIHQPHHRKET